MDETFYKFTSTIFIITLTPTRGVEGEEEE